MRVRVLGLGALLTCAMTAPAEAATLVNSGGTLTYTGAPGESNSVALSQADDGTVTVESFGGQVTLDGCAPIAPPVDKIPMGDFYSCPGVTAVALDGGDLDDYLGASAVRVAVTSTGGSGDDALSGGRAADILDGGDGDDTLYFDGGDLVRGGDGIDRASFEAGQTPFGVSLDGNRDDGVNGVNANVLADIEDVTSGLSSAPGTITGNDRPNDLRGARGDETITGGAGSDVLSGDAGQDVLNARDAEPDRVDCGAGTDVALADQYDQVGDSCETVLRELVVNPVDDRAPGIAWAGLGSARLRPRPATTLNVDATDDHGVRRVEFFDDDRLLCTDEQPPFSCAYEPRVDDVGRNTLLAVATDVHGQTATVVRAVEVRRFKPRSVSLRVTRRGNRITATGKATLPAGVPCEGVVAVRTGRLTRTDRLGGACTYRVTVTRSGRPALTATYRGTDAVAAKRSATRRAGR